MKRRLLDANIVIRHLTGEPKEQAAAARRLFAAGESGELELLLLPAVLAECVFVLSSFYQFPRASIGKVLSDLITAEGIAMADVELHVDALNRYRRTSLHFVDCLLAAAAASQKIPVASFDAGFKVFPDVATALE